MFSSGRFGGWQTVADGLIQRHVYNNNFHCYKQIWEVYLLNLVTWSKCYWCYLWQLWMWNGLNNVAYSERMSKNKQWWCLTKTSLWWPWHSRLIGTNGKETTCEMKFRSCKCTVGWWSCAVSVNMACMVSDLLDAMNCRVYDNSNSRRAHSAHTCCSS